MNVWGSVSCKQAVSIFKEYLEDPDSLPRGWSASKVQASIVRSSRTGFSLTLAPKKQVTPHTNGTVTACPVFQVLNDDPQAGFKKGKYIFQVYGNVTCSVATQFFRAYLVDPEGLPGNWKRTKLPPGFTNGPRNGFGIFKP